MKKKLTLALIIVIGFLLIAITYTIFKFPFLINCATIQYSTFNVKDKSVYFSPSINKSLQDSLYALVQDAKARNKSFWGIEPSQYTIIFCLSDKELEKYSGNANVKTISHLTPLGTYIVLGKIGYDLDIISHELCHAVLLSKVGYFNKTRNIPLWFDEGIALQLDNRLYLKDTLFEKNYKTDAAYLQKIANPQGFYLENWDETLKNYIVARYELKIWLSKAGRSGLDNILDNNYDFDERYWAAK